MLGSIHRSVIGISTEVVKIEIDVFKQILLIAFDGEVVVCAPLLNQVTSQLALGQQGIGGNGFALDVNGVQQGDGGLDFVGLFFLVTAFYGEGPHFFLGVTLLALVADDAHDVGLTTGFIHGVAHGFAIYRQALVDNPILRIPALQGLIQFDRVDANQHIAKDAFAKFLVGRLVDRPNKVRRIDKALQQ
jgi:hypothetical protein